MSDVISQIQASYHASEDRILLKIKTHNQQVYSAWITRRYLTLLIPALQGQHPTTGESLFSDKQALLNQGEQEKVQLEGDFKTGYQEPDEPSYPLGENPILLAKVTFKDLNSDQAQLLLEPEIGLGISLPFQPHILGVLLQIFSQTLASAHWQLDLKPILQLPSNSRLQ